VRLLRPDERAEPLGEHRVGGQAAADPDVVAGLALVVDHADERDVVDLVDRALRRAAGQRRLELARQVGELRAADVALGDLVELRGGVDDLVGVDPGERATEDDARRVAARLGRGKADRLQRLPDRRDGLDLDPVQLDVLPVGEVGGAAGVLGRHVGDRAQLVGVQLAAVDAHAQHEVAVVEVLVLQDRGLTAVDPGAALGVEAVPAEPSAQVGGVDGVEAGLGVDADDAVADVESVVVLLVLFVFVERFAITEGPLTLTSRPLTGWHRARPPLWMGTRSTPAARTAGSTLS
jgi:hypothetical protein